MGSREQYLTDALHGLGIEVSPSQASLLIAHLDLVVAKNKELNLTRIVDDQDGIILHIVDSLSCAPTIQSLGKDLRVLDLGTGGGFPGIPLCIMFGSDTTLLDSIRKKVDAVDGFITELGIQDVCHACCSRSEELALRDPSCFDVVVARAVASLNVLIELAAPLLVQQGALVALKAHISCDEFDSACKAAEICGMEIVSRETVELPYGYGHREIVYIRKNGEPHVKLPRRAGIAVKRPLGV